MQGRPQNQLVNEAVHEWVSRRARDVETDLEATLARLRAHRLRDPLGDTSMAAAMLAEAAVEDDPAEGSRVVRHLTGPTSARMLERLRG